MFHAAGGRIGPFAEVSMESPCCRRANWPFCISPQSPYGLKANLALTQKSPCGKWANRSLWRSLGPYLRTPNTGFNPGFIPRNWGMKVGGEPRVKPGVWRPEIWSQVALLWCWETFLSPSFEQSIITNNVKKWTFIGKKLLIIIFLGTNIIRPAHW
jgi:hypothetical protein